MRGMVLDGCRSGRDGYRIEKTNICRSSIQTLGIVSVFCQRSGLLFELLDACQRAIVRK